MKSTIIDINIYLLFHIFEIIIFREIGNENSVDQILGQIVDQILGQIMNQILVQILEAEYHRNLRG